MLMKRSRNYKNMFDPSTELMRGRLDNGEWIKNFNPQYPYYEYMYREANAWESSFFVPHDTEGLIDLYRARLTLNSIWTLFLRSPGIPITSPKTLTLLSVNTAREISRITGSLIFIIL